MDERMRKIREDAGLARNAFAARLGVSMNHIYMMETGRKGVSKSVAREVCRQFGVREAWLRTGEGEPYRDLTPALDAADRVRRLIVDRPDSTAAAVIQQLLKWEPDGPEWARIGEFLDSIKETHKESRGG